MTNLLKHPQVLEKARLEIDEKIGEDRLIDEPDLAELPYLQNVVSETFRLFPVAPLLVPRTPTKDMKIGGYDVPRDTIVLVNAWAIHRDPKLWDDPERFVPERCNNVGGSENYANKLMPFGNGRMEDSQAAQFHSRATIAWIGELPDQILHRRQQLECLAATSWGARSPSHWGRRTALS